MIVDHGLSAHSSQPEADLIDLIQESLVVLDLDGRITRWNRASERIYGWRRDEALGQPFADLLGGREWPSIEQMITSDAGPRAMELRRVDSRGEEVIICARYILCRGPGGDPVELVETGIDVTAQRRAELEAKAGRLHYQNVFRAIPAAVWYIDFSEGRALALSWMEATALDPGEWLRERPERVRELMRATYARDVNEQAMALFGAVDRDSLLVDIERYWPDASTEVFADWVASSLAGEAYFSRETRQRRFDGREFDAVFTASYAPGTVERGRLVVSVVDNSEIKRSQAAAIESEAFYADMFHGSAFAAFHLDARKAWAIFHGLYDRGVTDFRAHAAQNPGFIAEVMEGIRIVDVNATTLRLFEVPDRGAIIGSSIRPLWFPDRMEALLGSLEGAFNGITTFQGPATMRTFAGNEIAVHFTRTASPALIDAGQVLLAIVDMTDKVKAQNALAELQSNFAHAARVSSLGELTASIAHEVNQPLAAITANGEAALLWLAHQPPEIDRLRGLTEEMIADARRASDVVAHVRSMASPQAGRQERVALSALVEEALALLGSQITKCGAVTTLALQTDLPQVLGDTIQLQQVVVNLVLNALQAMAGQADARVLVRTWGEARHVVLTIEDNGPGIDDHNLERLFSSFFTTKPDGMGIGLAICRTIVEAHGGVIAASNLPTRGACFSVRLPLAPTV